MSDYKKLTKCLCCESKNLVKVLDLSSQPLANSYLKSNTEEESTFPLAINFCTECTHTQLTHAVNPDLLFKNYLYVSGTTKTLRDYFDWFVQFTREYVGKKAELSVLDIACNDGTQLNSFKAAGFKTYGIDPAENLHTISSKEHNVVCDYFNKKSLKKLSTKFDVIVAQNVFAHNTYPKKFLELCKESLTPNGCIFIQTSQANMFVNGEFDTIYHEHISFFSLKSFSILANSIGLNLIDMKKTDVHGTSYVFVLSSKKKDRYTSLKKIEKPLTLKFMTEYANRCMQITSDVKAQLDSLRKEGYKIIGYGAAAKGNTFLNFAKPYIDYIVDDNQLKQGLYTPGLRIPIKSPDILKEEKSKVVLVPLAWNFFSEIKDKVLLRKNKDIVFLKYFPKLELLDG